MLDPLGVTDTRCHPPGVPTVGAALTSTTAIITSPAWTPPGTGITTLFAMALAPVDAERKVIGTGGNTSIETVAVSERSVPSSTEYVNESGPVNPAGAV